ncbi:hypothetical protein [Paenibacillus polymyxa]|uniref:hypothetical protein n=1 Tax=Paenibacillus polymyxa TaxID=1406 RepID=UPI0001E6D04E|nr:hypothetical protein [Paenibacillus polymyxa]WPQ59542.1 hypothetical protein SKN87_28170 [Paenibacillus polymyxa]
MGEIAEMIIEGILCETCGSYIEEGEPQGFPRTCKDCDQEGEKRGRAENGHRKN